MSLPPTSRRRSWGLFIAYGTYPLDEMYPICGHFLTPSPCGTSPISLRSQGQKRLLYSLQRQKSIFLLLCVAEQYRGAVELCETEGLKKSTRVFITFTPIFRNKFKLLPLRIFVESRRSRLVSGTDKKTSRFHSLLPLTRHEPRASWLYGSTV